MEVMQFGEDDYIDKFKHTLHFDMLHSFQPLMDPPLESDQGIDIWYPQGSGRTHFHQMGL